MVNALLLSLLLAQATAPQKAAPPQPRPTTPQQAAPAQPAAPPKAAPAQPRTTTARQPAAGAVAGMAITVTDGKGMPFSDVSVDLSGAISRSEKTNAAGQVTFPGLRAGTYRLRFSGSEVTAFEREVTLKAGEIAKLPITLTPAPPPPKPVEPPPAPAAPPPAPTVGPVGAPQLGSLSTLANQQRSAKERREVLLSCSGNTRNVLLVLVDEQPQRIYDGAESTYYVLSGQGAAIVGKIQSTIAEGSFISVPRGTPFSIGRKGNRPLALLWTLSGEPCEVAK
jgi:mannose-6-phosphate isomerase-like protein (cupin superfamily)